MILGRGHGVTAETTIRNSVMKRILKIDPDILFDAWSFFPIVSSIAGTHGNGLHVSNALTLQFILQQDKMLLVPRKIAWHISELKREKTLLNLSLHFLL